MTKNYIIANIRLCLEISENGQYKIHENRTQMDFEPCNELLPIQDNKNIIGALQELLKPNTKKSKIKWDKEDLSSSSEEEDNDESSREEETTYDTNPLKRDATVAESESAQNTITQSEPPQYIFKHETQNHKTRNHLTFKCRKPINHFTRKRYLPISSNNSHVDEYPR
jgi:hypothetical protein